VYYTSRGREGEKKQIEKEAKKREGGGKQVESKNALRGWIRKTVASYIKMSGKCGRKMTCDGAEKRNQTKMIV